MPAAPGVKQTVEVGKPGEYTIVIGDTLKRSNDDGEIFTSVKYNFKPTAALPNPQPPRLTKHAPTGPSPFTLSLTPPGTPAKPITYTGSQHVHPPRKTECILLFDPATQSFTLEKLSSTFTFNAKVYAPAHPPLPLRPPIPDGEETDEEEREDDNPFDYRHFINKKPTTKTRAEQKAEREQRRKEALKRVGKDVPDYEPEDEDEDEDLGLGISYNGRPVVSGKGFLASPAIGPRRNVGGKSPFGGKKPVSMSPGIPLPGPAYRRESSSDEDESDEADDEEEDEEDVPPPPPPPQRVLPRKPAAPRRKVQPVEEPEELVFPEPSAPEELSEEISDVDESDEDAPVHPPPPPPPPQQEDEEDDEFGLAALLEKELENDEVDADGDVDVDVDADADADADGDADGEIIFEDDGEIKSDSRTLSGSGWGEGGAAAATTGGPISIAGMMGADDDSETSEEE